MIWEEWSRYLEHDITLFTTKASYARKKTEQMIFYGLRIVARRECLDGTFQNTSRRIFKTKEEAEAYIPEFSSFIVAKHADSPFSLDASSVACSVLDYELFES